IYVDDRKHDQVREDEADHPAEADAAAPEYSGKCLPSGETLCTFRSCACVQTSEVRTIRKTPRIWFGAVDSGSRISSTTGPKKGGSCSVYPRVGKRSEMAVVGSSSTHRRQPPY